MAAISHSDKGDGKHKLHGDCTLVSAIGDGGGGVGLGKVFGGLRENLGAGGGGERMLVSAVGA